MTIINPRRPRNSSRRLSHHRRIKYVKTVAIQRGQPWDGAVRGQGFQDREHPAQRGATMTSLEQARQHHEFRPRARTRNFRCQSCGKPITHHAGRRPSYCSARCRMREFGKGRTRKAFLNGDTGAPTKRQKIDSKNNALQRAKTQSSTGIVGPESVLAIEVFGRTWQSRTSSGGVAVEIAQLRPRVLIDTRRS
jgi:endogenous inhibitor of DNA gyrase (YacG/DUF329 family)